jgi:hypothetical protein
MSLLIFFLLFCLYLLTSAPAVYLGDSGGLTAAAFSLGPAHPPGYFLYVLLGKASTFLPFGNIAHRLSILTGFFSALSAVLVYKTVFRITGDRLSGMFAVSIAFLSTLIWSQSVMPEVYTLNLFVCSAVLYLSVVSLLEPDRTFRYLLLCSFLIGLGMANHHTVLLIASICVLVFVFNLEDIKDKLRLLSLSFILFVVGFMCNIGVLLRGLKDILYNHAMAADIHGFLAVLFRMHYKSDSLSAVEVVGKPSSWFYGAFNSLSFLFADTWYFILFLIAGIFFLYRNNRRLLLMVIVLGVLWAGIMGSIFAALKDITPDNRYVASVFFLPLYLPLCVLWGSGFHGLMALIPDRGGIAKRLLPMSFALLPVLLMLPLNYPKLNRADNYFAYQYGRDMLTVLPQKSVLVAGGDNPVFTTSYFRAVERYREDVILMGWNDSRWSLLHVERKVSEPHPFYPEFYERGWWMNADEMKEITSDGFEVFLSHEHIGQKTEKDFTMLFYGPVLKFVPNEILPQAIASTGIKVPDVMERTDFERLLDIPDASKDYFSWFLSFDYSDMLMRYGKILEETDREKARYYYLAAYRLSPIYDSAKNAYERFVKANGTGDGLNAE